MHRLCGLQGDFYHIKRRRLHSKNCKIGLHSLGFLGNRARFQPAKYPVLFFIIRALEVRVSNPGDWRFNNIAIALYPLLFLTLALTAHQVNSEGQKVEELLVVDCLLPGQIRKLGSSRTYLSARRPIKTTARDCEIRGGEYVTYDRANYATALKVWLPQAKNGDPDAQLNVGEIYEKGLGLNPDYRLAAHWYQQAAEQGDTRAQINLGHLYEEGLGVEQDPGEALNWYRKASGLPDTLVLDPGTLATDARQTDSKQNEAEYALRKQVEQLEYDTEQLRKQLEQTRKQLEDAHQKRDQPANQTDIVQQQDQQLADVSGRKEQEVQQLQNTLQQQQKQTLALKDLLDITRQQLTLAQSALKQSEKDTQALRSQLAKAKTDLNQKERSAENNQSEYNKFKQAVQQREADLSRQRAEMARLQKTIEQMESKVGRYRAKAEEADNYKQALQQAKLAGPSIALIDPKLPVTRGELVVTVRSDVKARQIIGRINAAAGLLSLTINDRPQTPNELGIFQTRIPLNAPQIPVSVIAIDQQGKRSALDFVLRSAPDKTKEDTPSSEKAKSTTKIPSIKFGQYYALVIGINEYRHLPKLETAISDADDVAKLLTENYKFKTTKLINADRYEILSALNDLREKLTKDDNLLIYYAGHGELDKVNMRGHWLPADAELDNTANWISNVSVTDILNIINAKQIMMIVDSCYSGALTRSALAQLQAGMTEEERVNWLKVMALKRSRTVLTSGGLKPTLDSGGGGHSVFAKALLDVLGSNDNIMEGRMLYKEVAARVAYAASSMRFEQVPEYAPIKHTGHEGGDFFFVPNI
ncbi:caspase family protein [Pseudomonadota bacterium]